jgi:phthiocerol/phenolphthiocerol synthesis type-I polyketide synthase D
VDRTLANDRAGRLYDVFRANILAIEQYELRPYSGPVVLLRAIEAIEALAPLGIADPHADDPSAGWASLLPSLEVLEVPGDHETMLHEPHVRIVASRLASRLR